MSHAARHFQGVFAIGAFVTASVALAFGSVRGAAAGSAAGSATGNGIVAGKPSASLSASASASASTSASVEFTVLKGTKAAASAIPSGFPQLASAPWTIYNHYVVLTSKSLPLTVGKSVKESLPSGHTVEITLVTPGAKPKFDLVLTDSKGKTSKGTFTEEKGKVFFPFHVPHETGGLVLAVKP